MASMVKQLTLLAVNQALAGATPVTRPILKIKFDVKSNFFYVNQQKQI